MENKYLLLEENRKRWLRLAVLALLAFLVLLLTNLTSIYLLYGIAGVFLAYQIFHKRPVWLLIAGLPFIAFGSIVVLEIMPGWFYEMSITEIAIMLAGIVFFLDKYLSGALSEIKIGKIGWLLAAYLIWGLCSYGLIKDAHFFVGGIKLISFTGLTYVLALNIFQDRAQIKYFLYSWSATAFIISSQVIATVIGLGLTERLLADRSSILVPMGAIALASAGLALMLPVVLAYYFHLDNSNRIKPFIFIIFCLGWLAIFLTLGKGAILSLMAGMLYLFFKLKGRRLAMVLAISTFAVGSFIVLSPYINGLINRTANMMSDHITEFRVTEYQVAWGIFSDHYLTGVGMFQQPIYFRDDFGADFNFLTNNFFMQGALDLGILGLLLIIAIAFYCYRQGRHIINNVSKPNQIIAWGLFAAFLAAFLNGLVEVTFFALPYAIIFWMMAGVLPNLPLRNK